MPSGERTGLFAIVVTRIAGLWILVGALLKLFVGAPEDLPQIVQDLPLELGLTYRLAIAAEMARLRAANEEFTAPEPDFPGIKPG